jgi:hypothetical protein
LVSASDEAPEQLPLVNKLKVIDPVGVTDPAIAAVS